MPLHFFIKWILRDSKLKFNNQKYRLRSKHKILLTISVFLVLFIIFEVIARNFFVDPFRSNRLSIDDYDPFLQNKLSLERNIHVDKEGFRGEETNIAKSPNTFRIIELGGSTVLSSLVPYEQSHARVLEKLLQQQFPNKKIEVLNAADNGYTSEHSLIQYLFKIKSYRPDLIIMWHGFNDLIRSCDSPRYTSGTYQEDYSHYWGTTSDMVYWYFGQQPVLTFHSYAVELFLQIIKNNFYTDITSLLQKSKPPFKYQGVSVKHFPSIDSYKRNLAEFAEILKKDNVPVIIGNQPFLFKEKMNQDEINALEGVAIPCEKDGSYPSITSFIDGLTLFNTATKEIANKEGLLFANLEQEVPKSLIYFKDFVHTTAKGDDRIAHTLYYSIISNNLIN